METSQARSIWCYYACMCFSGFAFRTCIGNRPPRGRVHLRLTEQLNHSWAAYIPRRVLPCIGTGTISETLAGAPETRGWWPTSLWQLGGTVFLWGDTCPPCPPPWRRRWWWGGYGDPERRDRPAHIRGLTRNSSGGWWNACSAYKEGDVTVQTAGTSPSCSVTCEVDTGRPTSLM